MTELHPATPASEFVGRTAMSRGVAEDMAAIFGEELRGGTAAPRAIPPPMRRPRGRRAGIAALAATGLAVIVGVGVIAGGSAVGVPATASIDAGTGSARRAAPRASTIAVAGPEIPAPVSTPLPDASLPPTPDFVAARVAADPLPTAMPTDRVTRLESEAAALPSVPARPIVREPVPVAPRQASCKGEDACLDVALDAAEREIAAAYAEAADAGVRARILRGYRNEWLRTRSETADRPREALRRYAMMTSDLRNFGEDATAGRRPNWR